MNVFIISRERWHAMCPAKRYRMDLAYGVTTDCLQLLDVYIVEESDGSATFMKDRYEGNTRLDADAYRRYKENYLT